MMKKILFCFGIFTLSAYAYTSKIINGYAVSIYDEKMVEENIQAKRKSKKDYQGICYTKVYIFGKVLNNGNTKVMIGNSIGHKIKENPIHKNRLIIGKEIIFKHYTVSKGYLKLYFDGKLLDTKTYIK